MNRISPLAAAYALTWREIVRFFRQRNRIVGSIGTPVVFWLLFGAGLSGSFRLGAGASQQSFLTYFFPGSLLLIVLFTAIFSSISIIEDRREGFLQGVLVAPIPRWAMQRLRCLPSLFGRTRCRDFQQTGRSLAREGCGWRRMPNRSSVTTRLLSGSKLSCGSMDVVIPMLSRLT